MPIDLYMQYMTCIDLYIEMPIDLYMQYMACIDLYIEMPIDRSFLVILPFIGLLSLCYAVDFSAVGSIATFKFFLSKKSHLEEYFSFANVQLNVLM